MGWTVSMVQDASRVASFTSPTAGELFLPEGHQPLAVDDEPIVLQLLVSLFDLQRPGAADSSSVAERVRELLIRRHGAEDFTITTQDQMLEVLGSVLDVLTAIVAALGAISLVVGGIGILTIMWIAVHERTNEIGLLRALGVTRGEVQRLFESRNGRHACSSAIHQMQAADLLQRGCLTDRPAPAVRGGLSRDGLTGARKGHRPRRRGVR